MGSYEQEAEQLRRAKPAQQPPEQVPGQMAASERLAAVVGNQAFGAFARQGAGILPDGSAHPDVGSAIARTRGGGQRIDQSARDRIGGPLGDPLDDVRVHTDAMADRLAQSVSARAFTTGSDVYFAEGEYSPGSGEGQQLLAHELTHVVQQRGASTDGPLRVSQPQDALETEAEAAANELVG